MNNNIDNRPEKKRWRKIILACVMALVVLVSFVGGYFSRYLFEKKAVTVTSDLVRIIEQFGCVLDPETGEMRALTESDYADALVNGLLDEYSNYFTEEEYEYITKNSKGSYDGFGFSIYKDTNVVFKVTGNSPCDVAGLKAGDKIVSVTFADGVEKELSTGVDLSELLYSVSLGSPVTLNVMRSEILKSITVTPAQYKASYVSYMDSETEYVFRTGDDGKFVGVETSGGMSDLGETVAYIRLDQFEGDAANQFGDALKRMNERGRTKLVLDLRNNGGGYMDVLIDVASYLIINGDNRKTVVAYSESKSDMEDYAFKGSNFYDNVSEIAVIANENTASASECLIGAMLCYGDRFSKENLIIEKNADGVAKTFGKGIMQTTYGLIKGGAFKLTTARILWPDKTTCIHGKGIVADGLNATEAGFSALKRAVETLG